MSNQYRAALFAWSLLFAVGVASQPADAAYLQISYTVTGGSFAGPNLSGAITGGIVSYRTNNGVTSLPTGYACLTVAGCGTLTKVTLTGTPGSFTLLASVPLSRLSLAGGTTTLVAVAYGVASGFRSGGVTPAVNWYLNAAVGPACTLCAPPYGPGGYGLFTGTANHRPTFGAEIRTLVPEPSTATLLGLGVLSVGCMVGGGSAARWRRRSQR